MEVLKQGEKIRVFVFEYNDQSRLIEPYDGMIEAVSSYAVRIRYPNGVVEVFPWSSIFSIGVGEG